MAGADLSPVPSPRRGGEDCLDFYVKSATKNDETWEMAVNPIEGFFSSELGKTLDAIMFGTAAPKPALQEMQRTVTEELRRRLGK